RGAGDDRVGQARELQRDLLDVLLLDEVGPGDGEQVLLLREAERALAVLAGGGRLVAERGRRGIEGAAQAREQVGAPREQVGHVLARAQEGGQAPGLGAALRAAEERREAARVDERAQRV